MVLAWLNHRHGVTGTYYRGNSLLCRQKKLAIGSKAWVISGLWTLHGCAGYLSLSQLHAKIRIIGTLPV